MGSALPGWGQHLAILSHAGEVKKLQKNSFFSEFLFLHKVYVLI